MQDCSSSRWASCRSDGEARGLVAQRSTACQRPPMRGWAGLGLEVLAACVSPPAEPATSGILRGTLDTSGADAGNGFVFLYPGNNPPAPRGTGRPMQVTGVPE